MAEDTHVRALRMKLEKLEGEMRQLKRVLAETAAQARVANPILTDNSGGTVSNTIAAISDGATKNAIASLADRVNDLIRVQVQLGRVQP